MKMPSLLVPLPTYSMIFLSKIDKHFTPCTSLQIVVVVRNEEKRYDEIQQNKFRCGLSRNERVSVALKRNQWNWIEGLRKLKNIEWTVEHAKKYDKSFYCVYVCESMSAFDYLGVVKISFVSIYSTEVKCFELALAHSGWTQNSTNIAFLSYYANRTRILTHEYKRKMGARPRPRVCVLTD